MEKYKISCSHQFSSTYLPIAKLLRACGILKWPNKNLKRLQILETFHHFLNSKLALFPPPWPSPKQIIPKFVDLSQRVEWGHQSPVTSSFLPHRRSHLSNSRSRGRLFDCVRIVWPKETLELNYPKKTRWVYKKKQKKGGVAVRAIEKLYKKLLGRKREEEHEELITAVVNKGFRGVRGEWPMNERCQAHTGTQLGGTSLGQGQLYKNLGQVLNFLLLCKTWTTFPRDCRDSYFNVKLWLCFGGYNTQNYM